MAFFPSCFKEAAERHGFQGVTPWRVQGSALVGGKGAKPPWIHRAIIGGGPKFAA